MMMMIILYDDDGVYNFGYDYDVVVVLVDCSVI